MGTAIVVTLLVLLAVGIVAQSHDIGLNSKNGGPTHGIALRECRCPPPGVGNAPAMRDRISARQLRDEILIEIADAFFSHSRRTPEPYDCANLDHGTAAISDFGYAPRSLSMPEPPSVPHPASLE